MSYYPALAMDPEGRFAATIDFTFNLGSWRLQTATLRRRINQRDWFIVTQKLQQWMYGGSKKLGGLVV